MFKKILIANRGEIACRIARTCRRMGIAVATVHSAADRDALHVREIGESLEIGPPTAAESYLAIERIVDAARRQGADAVHPGYGFLAENPAFVTALRDAGIAFIGPDPEVLARFGNKAAAKQEARLANVPVVPGTETPSSSVEDIVSAVDGMQLPVLLKAAAGGGGKGMRVSQSRASLRADVEAAMREGRSAFGDPSLIVEEYLPHARHVEVQILGDGRGEVIHLFDRECSLQRRHQKVIEEAPVTSIPPDLRQSILDHAVRLGRAVHYLGLGTVEFIVKDSRAYFLEVNPRIQVEHPVTEEVTGLDLVELQIRAVADGRLPLPQDAVAVRGVAVEARVYAEDPAGGFLPSTGRVGLLRLPDTVRVDSGIESGASVTPYYDPMVAKLIAAAQDRETAYDHLASALDDTVVLGVTTNVDFLRKLATDKSVLANDVHTGTIEDMLAANPPVRWSFPRDAAIAAVLWLQTRRSRAASDAWSGWAGHTGWRLGDGTSPIASAPALRLTCGDACHDVRFGAIEPDGAIGVAVGEDRWRIRVSFPAGAVVAEVDDQTYSLDVHLEDGRACFSHAGRSAWFSVEPYLSGTLLTSDGSGDGQVRAPMMGRIIAVEVEVGQPVAAGERLGLMESMKMEMTLAAPFAGTITEVACAVDATVERDQRVFSVAAE
ncbi:acetyl/propionyl/methylcrotonyl-CoA carboxylase subunit alpha [Microbaculum marinisediminis]|uniref:ATP-grasp domain-containing protein n=1 Tax=Microbaculum marinisediminis TaxID=2931392 RepID=A0AAW5R2X7_9HYPH|nr:biotin carboxylase N-terminal domain-containing protein [Microbaculum sp. A6E488]MCT8974328.1 ATP-grasp domain-containing protein [Microbaculum sp. A6E488]